MPMNTLDKRQIIILTAFCLPLFALVFISYVSSGQPVIPKIVEKKVNIPTKGPSNKPTATLVAEQERIRGLIKEAEAMTPEQYLQRQKTEPTFAASTLEVRIARLKKRLTQLEKMSNEQWENERRVVLLDPSKQLAPSPKGAASPAPAKNAPPAAGPVIEPLNPPAAQPAATQAATAPATSAATAPATNR
jgi:hypothetical protein